MRTNKVVMVLGRRGSGKTTFVKNLIAQYHKLHPHQKILVVDTFDNPVWELKTIHPEDIKRWRRGMALTYSSEPEELFEILEKHLRNALVVFEDAVKYIGHRLPPPLKRLVIDSKQKNLDIIFVFHSFGHAPLDLWRLVDYIEIFKTADSPEIRKNYIVNFEEVQRVWEAVTKSPNPYEHGTVQVY